jgi:hypothetical protein
MESVYQSVPKGARHLWEISEDYALHSKVKVADHQKFFSTKDTTQKNIQPLLFLDSEFSRASKSQGFFKLSGFCLQFCYVFTFDSTELEVD